MRSRAVFLVMLLAFCSLPYHTVQAATNLHGLIVFIDFPDRPATISVARANNIINGVGYTEATVNSSLRDYWYAQSRGAVVLTHDIVGYYRAPQPSTWYDTQPFTAYIDLLRASLDWVVATYPAFNWNALSLASGPMNRNGTEEGRFLSLSFMTTAWIPGTGGTHFLTGWQAPNGVRPQQVTGATFISPWDADVNLFWLTHEQGHSIWGWPDTYDTNAVSHGTGKYTVMSGNQYTGDVEPVGGPFLLQEGWVQPVDIRVPQTIILTPDGGTSARYRNPLDPREYFVIEARKNTTIGNAAFPVARGLLIWHVDERVTTSNTRPERTSSQHYRISVEQADGQFDLERFVNPGDAGDIYVPGHTFTAVTTPSSKWWDGSESRLGIDNIQLLSNGQISFRATVTPIAPADSDGDRRSDQMVYRPSNGRWYLLKSSTSYNTASYAEYPWGISTDVPLAGDFDGDGMTDITNWRPSNGYWFVLKSSTNFNGNTPLAVQWGLSTDLPVIGDFDGDGRTDIAVWRSSNGYWFILKSSTNYTQYDAIQWGASTDTPLVGDFDGDGRSDLVAYRPPTGAGSGVWYILKSSTDYDRSQADARAFGLSGDLPLIGDFDGDGKTDVTVYRAGGGYWFILRSSTGYADFATHQWGLTTDMPVVRDFDGDARSDITVYRPGVGFWFTLYSGSNYNVANYTYWQWGAAGDVVIR